MKKEVNSFLNTDLLDFLNKNGIRNLVICGMQTNMCLEAATRAASDFGFGCTVIYDACAAKNQTFNGKTVKAEDVHLAALATLKAYAKVISTSEYLGKKIGWEIALLKMIKFQDSNAKFQKPKFQDRNSKI